MPILVLYPIPVAHAAEAVRRGIAITAGDEQLLADLAAAPWPRSSAGSRPRRLAVHLELETGLGRGGLQGASLERAASTVEAHPRLRLAGLWTHLQAAEDAARTQQQVDRFDAAVEDLRRRGHRLPRRHVAASGGLLLGTVAGLGGVRPGLAVYGIVPDELLGTPSAAGPGAALRPALALYARPVRVADLPAGWGIGYGPTFVTRRPSRIATLPLGYGDGWPRSLSNRAEALVRGCRVPLVGNVAMDAVMADVTEVPGPPVSVTDEFVLLGRQGGDEIRAADLAATRSTNSWEVVTAMAARLPRVYHATSGPQAVRTLDSRGSNGS